MENQEPIFSRPVSRRQFIGTAVAAGAGLSTSVSPSSAIIQPVDKAGRTICIFSKHLQWLSLPEVAQTVLALGFKGVDLTVRKGGHVEPERVTDELPKAIAILRKAGLEVPMIVTDIVDADDPQSESLLKTAGQLGIQYYRMGYLNYDRRTGVAQNLEQYKKQLQKLARLNQKHNIHGAYQNHAGTRVGAAVWDLWELLKETDPRWLGCQYDIKHAVAEGGLSWVNGLDVIKSHIHCVDIKDFVWAKKDGKWREEIVPLGEGMVDFKTYFARLKQYGISGPMSVHYEYTLGGAETGKKQLTMPPDDVLAAMKRDLQTLQKFLKEAALAE